MATSQRIKGQEVSLNFVVAGQIVNSLTDIKSFDVNVDLETLEEGYLGQTSNQYDEVFKGISGKAQFNFSSPAVFLFVQAVLNRAQRREPGTQINIKATLNFPSGQRAQVLIPNAFFEAIPIGFAGRTEYGMLDLSYKASGITFLST